MKQLKWILLFCLNIILCNFIAWGETNNTIHKSQIDDKIQAYIKDKPIKAVIYGLWINGKPVSINALGESMTAVPATTDMYIRIGGVGETFLTTLLMQLVEKGQVKLTDTIDKWYPDLPNAKKVTIKMLANGTSGYPDFVYNKKFVEEQTNQPFKQWNDASILEFAMMTSPRFEPGTSQGYSHTDYVILGSILTKITHQPMEKLFNAYIFKKLNMQQTQYNSLTAEVRSPVLHSFSKDRSVYEDATFWNPSWTSYGGALTSTIKDLGIWGNAWMQGKLLTQDSVKQMRAADNVGKGKNKKDLYFAMDFIVANHWLIQNPLFGGYSGLFAVLPEKNMVFAAFTTLKENYDTNTVGNYSTDIWREIGPVVAPEYPIPKF